MAKRNLFADMTGVQILPSKVLPLPVHPREEARRIVRHGMKDVLLWLGEPVGPDPKAPTHMFMAPINGRQTILVSDAMFALIASGVVGDYIEGKADPS